MIYRFIVSAIFIITLSGLSLQAQKAIYLDSSQPIEKRIANALSLMTTEEKVAICHAQSKFTSKGVPRLGIPELMMSDGPHGVREEIKWDSWDHAEFTNDSCTAFPALTCLAATFNPELALLYGRAIGQEARYRNKNVLLGPGVNIYRTPLNGRNFEYLGEDPYLASKLVVPYIKGVQENGVAACVKHFALNNQENDRNTINVNASERALREIYLPAFKAAVEEGKVWTLMGSYNQFRGEFCTHNDYLNNKILKGEWKFDGAVISDWGAAHDTKQSVKNGLDIEMGSHTNGFSIGLANAYDNYYLANPYLDALKKGETSMSVLDEKAGRVLRLIFRTVMNSEKPWGSFGTTEHGDVGRKIGEEGIVLLKNKENILPLKLNSYKTIAVIGENAIKRMTLGGGSSELKAKYEISPLLGITKRFGKLSNMIYSQGYASGESKFKQVLKSRLNEDSLLNAAVNTAKSSDLVVFVGGLNKNHEQDSEGGDRTSYNLPYNQDKLIQEILKVNKNVVVVILSGNAVAMPWLNDVKAIIQAWYLGSEAGSAIASVLSGDVNPSGKLPFTYPVKLSDCGAHSFGEISYPGVNQNQEYKDDILVGYRWYDTKKISPMFPFGFGLSYTTFELGKAKTDKTAYKADENVLLTVSVKNTGKLKGAEVIQVFINQEKCSVIRPAKELKTFSKIELEAGETKQVELKLPVKEWAFYNDKTNKWDIEPGKFNLLIGTSAGDIRQKININVN